MKPCYRFILLASILAFAGCSPAAKTNAPANDTRRLDEMPRGQPESADFVARVKHYYQSLEEKDWPTSYDMRTATFKQDVAKDYYLKEMAGSRENLTSYKVLSLRSYTNTRGEDTAAEMIMEFHNGEMVSYGCARWIKLGGVWMCDEPGLKSGLLINLRIPDWVPQ